MHIRQNWESLHSVCKQVFQHQSFSNIIMVFLICLHWHSQSHHCSLFFYCFSIDTSYACTRTYCTEKWMVTISFSFSHFQGCPHLGLALGQVWCLLEWPHVLLAQACRCRAPEHPLFPLAHPAQTRFPFQPSPHMREYNQVYLPLAARPQLPPPHTSWTHVSDLFHARVVLL